MYRRYITIQRLGGITIVVELENNSAGDHVVLYLNLLDPDVPNIRVGRED